MSELWDPIFGRTAVAGAVDDRAWITALCEVEAALATACASVGLIDEPTAERIRDAGATVATVDPAGIGAKAARDGNPVIPVVHAIRDAAGPAAAPAVHLGATSQDILDTAAMLVAGRALSVVLAALDRAADACATLAAEHRDTPQAGRTLLQLAVPTTFGAVAAGWGEGLDRVGGRLRSVRSDLAVQLGGAAGTLAGWDPHGPAVRAALAAELGLTDPGTVWHTERSRIAELAGALGAACGAVGKVSTDVVLLAQTEVGEVREGVGGGSSTMAHKHNPIAAITARAGAAQSPGLVATILAALPAELQRGAGPWHAEWLPLTSLLTATGGAATRLADSLTGLEVDVEAMRTNLERLVPSGSGTRPAAALVDRFLKERRR